MRLIAHLAVAMVLAALPVWSRAADAPAGPDPAWGKVEVVRDTWGISHVFSDSDAGAMYGLGWAACRERGFQMHYGLRIIQGRLAEVIGDRPRPGRRETAVDNDRKMRTFGFYRAARAAAQRLDPDTRGLLDAHSRGVNDYQAAHADKLHPLFKRLGLEPEPWTPADCIASAWHLGQFFATDGTRELISYNNQAGGERQGRGGMVPPKPGPLWTDESTAVVQRADVPDEWVQRVEKFAAEHWPAHAAQLGGGPPAPKFSHAWVVGKDRSTTGSAVLVSDPQTPVRFPSLWHEFHVAGRTFNARGIGVPGSPGLLVGFNRHVAWGVTALGADQADLFRLVTDRAHPDQYRLDGQWRDMTLVRETIRIRGGRQIELTVRETVFGPVVTEFAFARPNDPQVALKRVPLCRTDRETTQAAIAMLRATGADSFAKAISGWGFPSINVIFGDRAGNIGYWLLAAVPIRPAGDDRDGRAALDGSTIRSDWRGFVPHDLLPHVINPKQGWIVSANHRPVGSFYPIPLGVSTGAMGDTIRSWRLRELLSAREHFEPKDVLAVHFDTTNPARREIVRIGLHLRDRLKRRFSPDAAAALERLEAWQKAGARSDLDSPGAEVALELNTFFRIVATPLAAKFGGGESGLSRAIKDAARRIDADPDADFSADEQAFVDLALAGAWQSAKQKYGQDPARWSAAARAAVQRRTIGSFDSLDGFGSLDPAADLKVPALTRLDGGSIGGQPAQSYTQFVPLHDPDQAMTLQPPGHDERADSPPATSTVNLWQEGKLHPAPLSREAVNRIVSETVVLSKE